MTLTKRMTSGVDYLTASMRPTEANEGLFYAMSRAIRQSPKYELSQDNPWFFRGYRGFILLAGGSGHFAYGEHPTQGYLVQMSGDYSLKLWLNFVNVADNVSRIDIKTDCELTSGEWEQLGKYYYDHLQENYSGGRGYTLVMGKSGKGQTLYIGSRKSDQYGRVYDKSAETGRVAGKLWRFEVEYKRKYAKGVADRLAEIANEETPSVLGEAINATLYDWFDKRGVPPIFDRKGAAIDRVSSSFDGTMGKVEWIRKQVSPTVKRLILSGQGQVVIDALELDKFYEVTPR